MPPLTAAQYLVHGVGLGICLAVLVLIALRLTGNGARDSRPLVVMAVFVLLLAGNMAFDLGDAPALLGLDMALLPPLPVLLWTYVRLLTGRSDRLWRHAVAPVAALLSLVPLVTLDAGIKAALMQGRVLPQHIVHQVVAGVGVLLCWLIWMALLAGYGLAILRDLRRHGRDLRDVVSDVAGLDLAWVRGLMILIAGVVAITALDQLATIAGHPLLSPVPAIIFEAAVALAFGGFGLQQDVLQQQWRRQTPVAAEPVDKPYARSPLTEADCDRILARLDTAMTGHQLWRDPMLGLQSLAETAGVKPNSVSQALNTRRQCNFFDYVNGWRVREACSLLATSDMTILAISEAVGFNAKSTFNAAFVRHTGQPPSRFRAGRETAALGSNNSL